MGIQINGANDTISASDGSLSVAGQQLTDVTNINATGIVTATTYVVGAGSASAPSITPSGDPDTGLYSPGADQLALATGGSNRLHIAANGNIGVGTTSPDALVHLRATSPFIRFTDTVDETHYAHIGYSDGSIYVIDADAGNNKAGSAIQFKVDNTEYARIDSSGRLLIGASSTSASCTAVITGRSDNPVSNPVLRIDLNDTSPADGDALGNISFSTTGQSSFDAGAWILALRDGGTWTNTSSHPSRLVFGTTADGASSPTERMRIDSSGRIGIGAASPNTILDIRQTQTGGETKVSVFNTDTADTTTQTASIGLSPDSRASALAGIEAIKVNADFSTNAGRDVALALNTTLNNAKNQAVYITHGGNFGIGTTSPGALLTLRDAAPAIRLTADANDITELQFGDTGDEVRGNIVFRNGTGGNALCFHTNNNNEQARIDSSGRLLVGTSSVYADSSELFEVHKTNGTNNGWISSTNLANDDSVSWRALGGVSGVNLRQSGIGVYKHSGIATPCGFLYMQAQNADTLYYWTDNSSNFRISTFASNIGTTSGTVVGTQTSDERIKNIIGPVEYGLETVKQINPVRYSLKADPETEKLGFIAQQVAPLVPQAIYDTNEPIEGEPEGAPTKLGMEYVSLIPVLVNAIKELSAEVDSLKAQLQAQ